jgi:hypothetical protein
MFALPKFAKQLFFVFLIGILLVACGGDEEPTAVPPTATVAPAAPTATPAPTEAPAAPVSPLDQPQSPLSTPISGTTAITGTANAVAPAMSNADAPPVPASKPGTGTITGRLISLTTGMPLNHEVVRLGEVTCYEGVKPENIRSECVWMLFNAASPSAFTDENGYFVFNDLELKKYIVIVGDVQGKNVQLKDEDGPFMWDALADEIVDVGEYQIEW